MSIIVGKVVSGSDDSHFKAVNHNSFPDTCVEDGVLSLGVGSNHNQKVGLVNSNDLGVHQVGRAQVSVQVRSVTSNVKVVAVESVKQVFECNDAFNVLELANNTLDLVTTDTVELF